MSDGHNARERPLRAVSNTDLAQLSEASQLRGISIDNFKDDGREAVDFGAKFDRVAVAARVAPR